MVQENKIPNTAVREVDITPLLQNKETAIDQE
jgi:hypothetical protein